MNATAAPATVLALLDATVERHAERPALRSRRAGSWQTTTWGGYRDQVRRTARGLMALGVQPGDGVVIMGYNRPEWFLSDLGAIGAGARSAGIYSTSTPEQCRYITDHADASVVIVENAEHLEKFLSVRERLPRLRAIVVMNDADAQGGEGVMGWPDLLERADSVSDADLDARIAAQQPEDVCTLIYTSGTTGEPKGVMITHRNVTWLSHSVREVLGMTPDDRMLSYLPLSHVAERAASLYTPMACGGSTWFAESLDKLGENLRECRPTLFFAVPRVWEKMQAGIIAAGAASSLPKKKIAAWARGVGLASGYADQRGEPRPWTYPIADALVFSKVRKRLGLDQTRYAIVSAAPIAVEALEFFLSLGIPIIEVYGMSEATGPATIAVPDTYRTGWAGRAFPGTEIRLAEDGEVLFRGPHVFKGYYKDEAGTRETLDADGWIHSGDVGELDTDGYLRITDRKKELLITAGGKNVAPQPIEGKLRQIAAVSQAVVFGDRRSYIAALLTLDPQRLAAEARAAGSPARSAHDAASCERFRAHLQRQIDAVNEHLPRHEQVRRFAILPEDLSIDGGELTPTMKLKRRVVYRKYAEQIEALYADTADR